MMRKPLDVSQNDDSVLQRPAASCAWFFYAQRWDRGPCPGMRSAPKIVCLRWTV
jgi:hypothetical protein